MLIHNTRYISYRECSETYEVSFHFIVVPVPSALLEHYMNQSKNVTIAIDAGNLTTLTEDELASIHPAILLLFPVSIFMF